MAADGSIRHPDIHNDKITLFNGAALKHDGLRRAVLEDRMRESQQLAEERQQMAELNILRDLSKDCEQLRKSVKKEADGLAHRQNGINPCKSEAKAFEAKVGEWRKKIDELSKKLDDLDLSDEKAVEWDKTVEECGETVHRWDQKFETWDETVRVWDRKLETWNKEFETWNKDFMNVKQFPIENEREAVSYRE